MAGTLTKMPIRVVDLITQRIAEYWNLTLDHLSTGPSYGFPTLDASFKIEYRMNVIWELLAQRFEILYGELIQLAFSRLRKGNSTARYMVCFAKWNLDVSISVGTTPNYETYPFANKVVSKVCGKYVHRQGLIHLFLMNLCNATGQSVKQTTMEGTRF